MEFASLGFFRPTGKYTRVFSSWPENPRALLGSMAIRERYLEKQIKSDLSRKMVFVPGARQVGKTTLARRLLGEKPGYLNVNLP